MSDVARSYEALRLVCSRCDHQWPAVYEVTRWVAEDGHPEVRYAGSEAGVAWPWAEARCPHCGGPAEVSGTGPPVPGQRPGTE